MADASGIAYRLLAADELGRIDEIDRSQVIDRVYRVRDGALIAVDEPWDGQGWPGWSEDDRQRIAACLEHGGAAWGAFDGERLVGIAVLDGRWIGAGEDTLDLYFLHVTNGYRDAGIGRELVGLVTARARELGARRLYVSATPSVSTVSFYQRRGFGLASEVDAELYALEPEDVHMDLVLLGFQGDL